MKALIPKRAFVSVLLSLLVLLLCACGAAQTAPAAETAVPEPTEEPVPEELTLGPLTITPETKSISLDGTGVALEELMALSGRIDGVESISLGITAGNLPQLYAVRDAFPNARVSWQAELPGQTVDNTAEELDLTAAQDGDLKTITDALAILPNVRTIRLAPEDGATQLSFESLAAIAAAAPEAELNCRFELFGQTARQMKFRKLLVVAEPCYGECVIRAVEGIPGVLAMSGANSQEQSWADCWSNDAKVWMCDRFSQNLVNFLSANPDTSFRDLFLYCAQHTLGSHARIVNAANFGNLYTTGPAEFIRYIGQ